MPKFTSKKSKNQGDIPQVVLDNNFVPSPPGVNIIPPDILEGYANTGLIRKFAFSAAAIVLLGLLGYMGTTVAVTNAEKQLDVLRTENQTLTSESVQLAPGKQFIDTLEKKRSTLADKVSLDISNSAITAELVRVSDSSNSKITNFSVTPLVKVGETESSSAACPSPDPFGTVEGVACISFTVESGTSSDANTFTTKLNDSDLFTSVFVQSLNTSGENAIMQGSVLVNTNALNTRFETLQQSITDYLGAPTMTNDTTAAKDMSNE